MKLLARALAVLVAATFSANVWAAEYELKISTMFPSTHFVHTLVLEPWAKEIEEKTDGRVNFTFFVAGSALGDPTRQYDQVRTGVVDVAVGLPAIPRGRHPRTTLIELPFTVKSSDAGTRALVELYDDQLAADFPGTKMLSITHTEPTVIHTKTPVTKIEDLEGLRIRVPTPAATAVLESIGAIPIGMGPSQIYESVERGVLDGAVMPWGPTDSFKLWEILPNHFDVKFDTISMYVLMNENRYESLPPDIQAVFDEMSGDWFTERWGQWWRDTDQITIDKVEAHNNTITTISDEERAAAIAKMKPVIEKYIQDLSAELPEAPDLYQLMVETAAKNEQAE